MDVRTAFFGLLLVVLGAIGALMVLPLVQYVLAASLLAFVLYPAHDRLERVIGTRPSALALTVLAVALAVAPLLFFSLVLLGTVLEVFEEITVVELLERSRDLARTLGVDDRTLLELEAQLLSELEGVFRNAVDVALLETVGLLTRSFQMGVGLLVVVFLLYYLLVDGEAFVEWIGDVAPIEADVREELFAEINVVTWAVIQSHVLVALVEGLLGGLGFYLLGVPNVAFWTIVMIVVSFLPVVGVWIVWGPAVGYLAFTSEPVYAVALFLYGVTALSLVDNYLRAIFVDRESGLHSAVVLIGVIGGIYLLGIMGLFLGPVILAVLKACLNVFSEVYDLESGSTDPTRAGAESDPTGDAPLEAS